MSGKIFEKHRVYLKVMTETHIWSGDILLRNIDLIACMNNSNNIIAYIIDMNKLIKSIIERNVYNDLINAIENKNILKLLSRYRIDAENVALTKYRSKIEPQQLDLTVKKHLLINNVPLIPGSEIKGLIRTAILNYMISHNIIDRSKIDNILKNLSFSENIKNIDLPIEMSMKRKISVGTPPLDLLRFVSISDPLKYSINPVLDKFITLKLINEEEVANEDVIALDENSVIEYELSLYHPVSKEVIKGVYNSKAYEELLKLYKTLLKDEKELKLLDILKVFSLKLLDFEIQRFNNVKGEVDKSFISRLKEWKEKVSKSNNLFYFKIGYGAGVYSKTIFLSMDPRQRNNLINIMSSIIAAKTRGRINVWDTLTMKIVGSEYLFGKRIVPVGWVRLEIM